MSDLSGSNKIERCILMDAISCCLHSGFPCNLVQLSKFVLYCSLKTAHRLCMISSPVNRSRYIDINNPVAATTTTRTAGEDETVSSHCEKYDEKDNIITYDDINAVISNLGVEEWRTVQKKDDDLIQEAHKFLDSKNASMEELKEAFYVFDRNEDGFITALELWSVLRRLRLKEGMKYDDCEEMIRVYDKDGDGRISFIEFKDMMEQAL